MRPIVFIEHCDGQKIGDKYLSYTLVYDEILRIGPRIASLINQSGLGCIFAQPPEGSLKGLRSPSHLINTTKILHCW